MSTATETKAIAACQAYVRAMSVIRRLTSQIGDALSACHGNGEFDSDTNGDAMPRTHLRVVYGYHNKEETEAFRACQHCVLADKLVNERKSARQTLGAAKRQIGKIGMLL